MKSVLQLRYSKGRKGKEFVSPGGENIFCSEPTFYRWAYLPYGIWKCENGREVFFNRFYEPIWQRVPGKPPTPADPKERVDYMKDGQFWFYCDGTPENKKRKMGEAKLSEWGISLQ
jgi:hypothetical protein